MNELDKKITLDIWKQSQISIQTLRGTIIDLTEVLKALGEVKTTEEQQSFEKIESLICEALEEIEAVKNRFWKASAEAMQSSKN